MAHNVSRLYKVHDIFYYRVKIPQDLLQYFGGKEDVKRTLRTKSLTQARRLLRIWDSRTEQVFTTMRIGMLTDAQIRQLADDYLRISLSTDEYCRAHRLLPLTAEQRDSELQRLSKCLQETRDALTLGGSRQGDQELHELFRQEKCPNLSPKDPEYLAIERELLKRDIEIFRVEIERTKGNYANGYDDQIQVPPVSPLPLPTAHPPAEKKSPSLSDAIDKYIADYRRNRNATETSIKEYEGICRLFQDVMGNKELTAITRDDIRRFHETLKLLPRHINKRPQYRNKTVAEILEMAIKPDEVLSDTSVDKYMVRVNSFLAWAVNEGWIVKNPAAGVRQVKKKTAGPQKKGWKPFDKDDLARMVQGLVTVAEKGELEGKPERIWIPLIGLFSGARVNEIAQFHIEDVSQEKETGIWYFKIEEDVEGKKRVKTAAANRAVPIHPQLIKLGFLHYFNKMKTNNAPRLWMNLTKSEATGKWHKNFVNWFLKSSHSKGFKNTYVTEDPLKVFHSFRKSFTNELKQRMVAESVIKDIVGHSQGTITFDTYTLPFNLKTMIDAMEKIDYGVDLNPLLLVIEAITPGEQKPVS